MSARPPFLVEQDRLEYELVREALRLVQPDVTPAEFTIQLGATVAAAKALDRHNAEPA